MNRYCIPIERYNNKSERYNVLNLLYFHTIYHFTLKGLLGDHVRLDLRLCPRAAQLQQESVPEGHVALSSTSPAAAPVTPVGPSPDVVRSFFVQRGPRPAESAVWQSAVLV